MASLRTAARDVLVAEQSSGRTGLAPLFRFIPFAHCLCRTVDEAGGGGGGRGGGGGGGHLSESLLRADRGTMTSSCQGNRDFKSVLATQPGSLDRDRDGHTSAAGQSECDE